MGDELVIERVIRDGAGGQITITLWPRSDRAPEITIREEDSLGALSGLVLLRLPQAEALLHTIADLLTIERLRASEA